jgi:cytochrome c-type biogenesis protein CcmH/NrfG
MSSSTKTAPSLSTTSPRNAAAGWTSTQAYLLAAFCLLLGVALGYLFRGSASPPPAPAASATQQRPDSPPQPNGSEQMQAAITQAAAPLLEALNKNGNDYESLVQLGNVYYDGQQYQNAIQYYARALAIHPENPDVRTDMGTAYWYTGNPDKAIEAMRTALKYRPGHAQSLFNLGWVLWQGKADPKGAIAAWQELLKANPNYPQKQQVEQYIAKAKEHAARG